ncbi:hypothetical protein GO013_09590 [Pseudodesulfovibrio sp. JC047]|uniref:hypothetical protein n=1 Tax=Pseudodesulfovibrio sp. JC047 TaxID=2683199 RepID=UPI0013D34A41|nr:hypothetical protein [Pseudodesulfovibrio sp. JC047]NDV19670.1 hypothetical protein [Pseudodesulfovibrio sp. JC047]
MRQLVFTVSLTLLLLALLLFSGCSRAWYHTDLSGAAADKQFAKDTDTCKFNALDLYPLDKRQQAVQYEKCLREKGWIPQRDYDGYRFETKPR